MEQNTTRVRLRSERINRLGAARNNKCVTWRSQRRFSADVETLVKHAELLGTVTGLGRSGDRPMCYNSAEMSQQTASKEVAQAAAPKAHRKGISVLVGHKAISAFRKAAALLGNTYSHNLRASTLIVDHTTNERERR